jgi:hypothetical protein
MHTHVLIKEECILKNKSKLCPFKKSSAFEESSTQKFLQCWEHVIMIHNDVGSTLRYCDT